MQSLKGFALKQWVCGDNDELRSEVIIPVQGTSMKIGSDFVCHIVLRELDSVHCIISHNELNQVSGVK